MADRAKEKVRERQRRYRVKHREELRERDWRRRYGEYAGPKMRELWLAQKAAWKALRELEERHGS